MLVEAHVLRRAARAYCRNGGDPISLAQGLRITRQEARDFLRGRYHFVTPAVTARLLELLDQHSQEWVLANLRIFQIRSGKIPMQVMGPVADEAVEDAGGVTALAHLTGIGQRRIHSMQNRLEGEVGFAVADKLVTRSLGPLRWQQADLRRWYHSADAVLSGHRPPPRTGRAPATGIA